MDSRTQLAWDWVGARVCDPGENQAGVICPRECRPWHHLPTEPHTDAPGHLLGQRTTLKHRRECGCAWDSGSTQRGCSAPALLPPGARLLAGRRSSILASPRQWPSPGVMTTKTACSRAWVSWLTVALLKGHCCLVAAPTFLAPLPPPTPSPGHMGAAVICTVDCPPCPLPARLKASQSGSLPGNSGFRTEAAAWSGGVDS